MSLRPYQTEIVNKIISGFAAHDKIMVQMPTGTGKTEVFAEVIRQFVSDIAPSKKILVLVHTRELVNQIHKRLYLRCGIRSGFILAGFARNLNLQVQIASIQTLIRRNNWPENLSLIVIDEAHHTTAESYRTILKHYFKFKVKLLGVTATPQRLDGTGFKDLYDKMLVSQSIKAFISDNWLAKVKHLAVNNLELNGISIQKGDYVVSQLAEYMCNEKRLADVTESYKKYGQGKKAIVFTVNRLHNKLVSERFNQLGIPASFIDSGTPKEEREYIINRFEKGNIKILCNVQIFTEGYDCPDVELCLLARPTKSLTLYLQMIGRVMRPSPGKEFALILDNSMLWKEHMLVTTERKWSLNGCKTTKNVDVIIDENTGEAKEIPKELKGKDFDEITDESIDIFSKRTTFPQIRKDDVIRITIKQERQGIMAVVYEFRKVSDNTMLTNKFAGDLCFRLCSELNRHLGKSSLFHGNRKMYFEIWFNGKNVTLFPKDWTSIVPNGSIKAEDRRKIGRWIYGCLRLINLED